MNPRVLVVDDDPNLTEMLTIVLGGEGFDCRVARHGLDAMPQLRQFSPDVVLLDLMMPGMDGIEVCKSIRANSDVPILMLSATSDTADIIEGYEAGANDYVAKPFKAQALIARIRAWLQPTTTNREAAVTPRD